MDESFSISLQACIDEGEKLFIDNELFFGHGTDNAADEALWLAFYQLGLTWDCDQEVLNKPLLLMDYVAIKKLYERRVKERIPAAYITGEAWFAGLPFKVNEHVLVPRSPIAECIYAEFNPWFVSSAKKPKVLDLCTGSGCIGIATAFYLSDSHVVLSDISAEAIDVAKQNITRHSLDGRVTAVQSDLFDQLNGQVFDLIICNPPYVDAEDFSSMPEEFKAEPEIALTSGQDGLDFTRRLLNQAANYLDPEGLLIVEVGNSWVHLEKAYPDVPFLWLDFEQGGHGVFAMTYQDLTQYFST